MQNNSFCTRNHAWGWSGARVQTIFWKFVMCKNGFWLITLIFFRNWLHLRWLPIPNRLCPVVLKGQNMVLGFSFFRARFFFVGPDFFHHQPRIRALFWRFRVLKHCLANAAWKSLSNELRFISNGGQGPELWPVLCSQSVVFFNNGFSCCVWVREAFFLKSCDFRIFK